MYKKISVIVIIAILLIFLGFKTNSSQPLPATWWEFQSIDTMKYSRDVSREKLNDPSFDIIINQQVKQISETGATHVGIATPYDEEFYPILQRWITAARRNDLKVWFRGNWSGWERWFDYPKITREEHIKKTQDFIKKHQDVFVDGDVFSPCPECENGGPGDPRHNGDLEGHRAFLIEEYGVTKRAFRAIGKDVASNYNSMNGDVARLVMDKKTTKALDGIVTIDHYVKDPEQLSKDVAEISQSSGGKVVLGEFGVPIPDINGNLSQEDQAVWIKEAMYALIQMPEVVGLNYWTNTGSSTALWDGDAEPREAVETLTTFYKAPVVGIKVKDEAGFGVKNAKISLGGRVYGPDNFGALYLPYFEDLRDVEVSADGYFSKKTTLMNSDEVIIIVAKINPDLAYKILKSIRKVL